MKTIHKFDLNYGFADVNGDLVVKIPKDSEILTANEQDGAIKVWALVNTENELSDYAFRIIGTGHEFNDRPAYRYINTVMMESGFVWHVWLRIVPLG